MKRKGRGYWEGSVVAKRRVMGKEMDKEKRALWHGEGEMGEGKGIVVERGEGLSER